MLPAEVQGPEGASGEPVYYGSVAEFSEATGRSPVELVGEGISVKEVCSVTDRYDQSLFTGYVLETGETINMVQSWTRLGFTIDSSADDTWKICEKTDRYVIYTIVDTERNERDLTIILDGSDIGITLSADMDLDWFLSYLFVPNS